MHSSPTAWGQNAPARISGRSWSLAECCETNGFSFFGNFGRRSCFLNDSDKKHGETSEPKSPFPVAPLSPDESRNQNWRQDRICGKKKHGKTENAKNGLFKIEDETRKSTNYKNGKFNSNLTEKTENQRNWENTGKQEKTIELPSEV